MYSTLTCDGYRPIFDFRSKPLKYDLLPHRIVWAYGRRTYTMLRSQVFLRMNTLHSNHTLETSYLNRFVCKIDLGGRLFIGVAQATDFGDFLLIGIIQTIDFGDCLLTRIVQIIDFGDCL